MRRRAGAARCPLVDERLEEAEGEERVAPAPLAEPVDQRPRWRPTDNLGGQLADGLRIERLDRQPLQQPFLLQAEQHLRGHRVVCQLCGPGSGHDDQATLGEVVHQVGEGLPG